ncbi:glycine cleavage system protein R [Polycladidibacter hongkongensis]|uniref:glycine cleavage system protein R n=1 Tax=Polycladidibacter hongkongensis TaxID=1647556 RepID=UPI000833A8B5|nr:ACT domain-containing protein [Pseudovibrio hongkongensis]
MKTEIVLTAVAEDRPGLVGEISAVVAAHGGNWIDSAMTRLGGQFAGVVRVGVAQESAAALEVALSALDKKGISIGLHAHENESQLIGSVASLSLIGQDQPGMISQVSAVLGAHGVSIDRLDSLVEPGSMSGEPMFKATAQIILPETLDMDKLLEALEEIAGDLMIEIEQDVTEG